MKTPRLPTPERQAARHWLLALLPLMVAVLFFALRCVPPTWVLNLGAPGDHHFVTRFSVSESGDGATFRWSTPDSRLLLHGAGARPFTLDMRLHRNQSMLNREYRVTLERGEQRFAAFALSADPGWRVYRVLLPTEAVADTSMRTRPLSLTSTSYYSPGSHDRRDLGVPLDRVRITPLPGAMPAVGALLLRSLILAWGLVVLAWALWRLRLLLAFHRRPVLTVWLVYVPVGGAALLLLSWAASNPYTLAWALPSLPWTLTLATLVLTLTRHPLPAAPARARDISPPVAALLVVVVLVLAAALRFYQLDHLPYGLWRDEAEHGLLALRMLHNPAYRPVYVAEGSINMPALGFYPFALALHLWGVHVWTLRAMTALAGALTVLPLYALARRLFGRADVALLAASFLAVSSWHLTMSRFSFPTIFEPLLSLTGLWLLLIGLEVRGQGAAVRGQGAAVRGGGAYLAVLLAGVCLGFASQMYHTGRVVPVVAGVLALLLLWHQWQHWRHWLGRGAVCAAGFVLVVGPLLAYAFTQPEAFNDRVSSVFLLGNALERGRAPLADFDDSLGAHMLMFNVQGDGNSRHHAPDLPLLDIVTGAGFLAGVVLLLRHWRDWRSLFVLAALAISMLPSLLAVDGPHAMRGIGAVAFACIIAAVGWVNMVGYLTRWLERRGGVPPVLRLRFWGPGVVALALALNVWTYFVYMPVEPRVWTSFYPIHTQMGTYLRTVATQQGEPALEHVYVSGHLHDNAVLRYLAHGLPVATFDEGIFSRPVQPGDEFVLSGYTHSGDATRLRSLLDLALTPVASGPALPGLDEPSFVVYRAQQQGSTE